jgi:ABC-type nitrate/sulfonate/bicarbonate transport system permease component
VDFGLPALCATPVGSATIKTCFQTVDMFGPIIAISLLGLLLNAAFNAISARLLVGFDARS